jgi:hypothetical protein
MEIIGAEEVQHASLLTGVLTALGVTPVEECIYDFNVTDVPGLLHTASVISGRASQVHN